MRFLDLIYAVLDMATKNLFSWACLVLIGGVLAAFAILRKGGEGVPVVPKVWLPILATATLAAGWYAWHFRLAIVRDTFDLLRAVARFAGVQ